MVLKLGDSLLFIFQILFIYSWEIYRDRDRDTGRGISRLHARSLMWDLIPGLQDHTLSWRQTLNHWATQASQGDSLLICDLSYGCWLKGSIPHWLLSVGHGSWVHGPFCRAACYVIWLPSKTSDSKESDQARSHSGFLLSSLWIHTLPLPHYSIGHTDQPRYTETSENMDTS